MQIRMFLIGALMFAAAGHATDTMKPPIARKAPKKVTMFDDTRVDNYGWIREKNSPEVTAYLNAENDYAAAMLKWTEPLQKKLYDEMLSHIKQTDANVPYRKGGYFYYSRTEEGKQYPIYARTRGSASGPEEVILDLNKMAEGRKFMALGESVVSDDGNLLAYSVDDTGYRQYTLHVKDLRTGEILGDTATRVGSIVWAADNKTLFYTTENDAKRQNRFFRHTLGSAEPDPLVYEDADELYDVFAYRSRSGDWIFIGSSSKTTTEFRTIKAGDPAAAPRVMAARRDGVRYFPEHRGDRFYIRANDTGSNYRIVTAPLDDPQRKSWTELVAHRKPVYLADIDLFANHMVISERENGLTEFEVVDLRDGKSHRIEFPEPAYAATSSVNEVFETSVFRYAYQSLVTPGSIYDYDLEGRKQSLLKRTEVPHYQQSEYQTERIFARAGDGAKIPVALVYRKGIDPHSGKNPLWLTAYGSYGASTDARFSSSRIALLDRGVIYAIASIRGGGELGKEWHEAGRMMTKRNTFTDFIAAAEHLIREKFTSSEKLIISGGSAGGLLMGAVTNMRPDLFKAVVAYVPFVDVMNTMLDPTLPLTTQEYIEWGNPNEKNAYFYMKSYDPYANVASKAYPAMLVRTSLNDSQVGYWQGVKWVAKLRELKTDRNPILLRVNMAAGHGGSSGRYDALRETASDYAYMLWQWGLAK